LNLIDELSVVLGQLSLGNTDKFDLIYQINVALIGPGKRFKFSHPGLLSTESLSLVEEVIFGSDCSEVEDASTGKKHQECNS